MAAAATGGDGPQATVIVLDASGSMQYRLGGQPVDVVSTLPPAAGHALYDGVADFVLLTPE